MKLGIPWMASQTDGEGTRAFGRLPDVGLASRACRDIGLVLAKGRVEMVGGKR